MLKERGNQAVKTEKLTGVVLLQGGQPSDRNIDRGAQT